jgi:hypothetical protein
MRVVLLVGRYSDGIASGPTRIQVCGIVHTHDKIAPSYSSQALAHSSGLRNIVTWEETGRQGYSELEGEDTCTRPFVGSAPVKN